MAKRPVKVAIKDYDILRKQLDKMQKAPKTVLERTVSDIRTRAPGWVSAEVVKKYNVKKSDLTPGKSSIGTIKVTGVKADKVRISYTGRPLTPTHFGLTPTQPKPAYRLKAGIFRGEKSQLGQVKKITKKQRKVLVKNFTGDGTRTSDHSPIMLMYTGNTRIGGVNYIPFQRKSDNRKDVEAIKTTSLPQMVSNKQVHENITAALNENLGKRLDHHMKLLEKK